MSIDTGPARGVARENKDVDRVRRHLLDGLMSSDTTALERSLYRTRLYAGHEDPRESWVQRAHASMRERGGQWGVAVADAHALPPNGQVGRAHAALESKGLWNRRRKRNGDACDGPRTPYETKLLDADTFPPEPPAAQTSLAYAAIKSLSLHVSPLGPEREDALCRCWYLAGADNTCAGTRKQWRDWLGLRSEKGAMNYLRDIEAAAVGLRLTERPPLPGSSAKLWEVSLRLPQLEKLMLPQGATMHAREEAEVKRFLAYLVEHEQTLGHDSRQLVGASATTADVASSVRPAPSVPLVADLARDEEEDVPFLDPDPDTGAMPSADEAVADSSGGSDADAARAGVVAVQLRLDGSEGRHRRRYSSGSTNSFKKAPVEG